VQGTHGKVDQWRIRWSGTGGLTVHIACGVGPMSHHNDIWGDPGAGGLGVGSPIAISHRTSRVLTCWYQALLGAGLVSQACGDDRAGRRIRRLPDDHRRRGKLLKRSRTAASPCSTTRWALGRSGGSAPRSPTAPAVASIRRRAAHYTGSRQIITGRLLISVSQTRPCMSRTTFIDRSAASSDDRSTDG
jgi:hypothetical protein